MNGARISLLGICAASQAALKDPTTGMDYPTSRPLFIRQNAGPALRGKASC